MKSESDKQLILQLVKERIRLETVYESLKEEKQAISDRRSQIIGEMEEIRELRGNLTYEKIGEKFGMSGSGVKSFYRKSNAKGA